MTLSAATALWLAAPRTAIADGAVMVVGDVSPHDRDVIVDTVRLEGTALSLRFSPSTSGRDAAEASIACLGSRAPWSCLAPAIRGKDQLVIIEIDSDRAVGAPMTVVTAHLLTAGTEADSFATRNCAMCNEDALKRTVSDLSRDLLQRAAARTGRTRLAIRSRPSGAQITLDGKAIETIDDTMATFPGKHTVVLQLPGYEPATREITAVDGQTTNVAVDLTPVRVIDQDHHPSQLLPVLAIGAGAAAIAAGGFLILFDQDPNSNGPQQPTYYDTAPLGTVTLAVGIAMAGAGIYLWRRPSPGSMATITPMSGGAAIGWAGRF